MAKVRRHRPDSSNRLPELVASFFGTERQDEVSTCFPFDLSRYASAQRGIPADFYSPPASSPHPPYVPPLRHALRAGSAVRFGILPSQSAPSLARGEGKARCRRVRESASALHWLCCARCAVTGAPMQRQGDVGIARRVGARDCAQFAVSTWKCCQRTPGVALRSRRAGCPETAASGWPSLWLLSLGHTRESDSLAGRRVKKGRDATRGTSVLSRIKLK